MEDNRELPDGKTCKDCVHVFDCVEHKGVLATNTTCMYEQSKFRESLSGTVIGPDNDGEPD